MKKILVVVDMQKDFVDGALGTKEAVAIVDNVVAKIEAFDGDIIATYDTHFEDYMDSAEGKKLPVVHCVKDTEGWQLDAKVQAALDKKGFRAVQKPSFGSTILPEIIDEEYDDDDSEEDLEIEIIGLCTDICVISNALILKAHYPEISIKVTENCCAGVTPEKHAAAIEVMKSCQIDIV